MKPKLNRTTRSQIKPSQTEQRFVVRRDSTLLLLLLFLLQGYTSYAWGQDELKPLTRNGDTSFGLGLTIVSDDRWLMNGACLTMGHLMASIGIVDLVPIY